METSARNQLQGTVKTVSIGAVIVIVKATDVMIGVE
jgi:molybdopterin-binding protein